MATRASKRVRERLEKLRFSKLKIQREIRHTKKVPAHSSRVRD